MMVLLDRERLLADLRAAVAEATPRTEAEAYAWGWQLQGMRRGWAILLNALEDGEYDLTEHSGRSGVYWPTERGWRVSRPFVLKED